MSSEDEFDYMSDDFLNKCVGQDIRPGLVKSRSQQRTFELEKKKQIQEKLQRPIHVVESEQRSKGLSEALNPDNKGFALLQKMGYKPGEALGKVGTGRKEPIPIEVKTGREGLGREAVLREIAEKKLELLKRRRDEAPSTDDFRKRMTMRALERQIESDLRKSQRICFRLDKEQDKEVQPAQIWFWPDREEDSEVDIALKVKKKKKKKKNTNINENKEEEKESEKDEEKEEEKDEEKEEEKDEEEEEEKEELEISDKLQLLTEYLRSTYMYCIWCGTQYDDERDFHQSCPGPTKEDH